MTESKGKTKTYLLLHALLLLYSFSGVLSKLASRQALFSPAFLLLYGGMLVILLLYAVFWQQILKALPLSTAFANKAVTLFWGIVWGMLFFNEQLNWGMIAGIGLVFAGILLVVQDNE
jgi:multidrug transporter EmrE-like cation transporter